MLSNREIDLRENLIISGDFGSYQIKELSGEGSYGRVARCIDQSTDKTVAIKIARLLRSKDTRHEAYILQKLSSLSQNKNVVKFITSFQYQDHHCLVLEHLDQSMFDFMKGRQFQCLHLSEIRYITEQLLETFEELAKYKMIHGDLKPNNIMLLNHMLEPFKIKLIDFGFATSVKSLIPGAVIQTGRYRAPEVNLGTKLDEAIDMWSLGCVMAFLFTGRKFFPGKCKYEMMRIITRIIGMPDVQQLREGLFTDHFFKETCGCYRLYSPKEYTDKSGKSYKPTNDNVSKHLSCLENMSVYQPKPISEEEKEAHRQFFHLLKKILLVNPEKRITPGEALTHPFIKQTTAAQVIASRGSTLETTNVKERKAGKTLTLHVEPDMQNEPGRKVQSTSMPKRTGISGDEISPKRAKRIEKGQGVNKISPESTKRSKDHLERDAEQLLVTNSASDSSSCHSDQNGPSSVWYSIVKVLVNTLMKKLFQYECGLDPKDEMYVAITDDLTQKVFKIYIPEKQVQHVDMSKKTFIIGVIKDLKKEFGPSHRLFKTATGEVESFVSSAERLFQKNLQIIVKTCLVWKP